jgi:hypothetical protein
VEGPAYVPSIAQVIEIPPSSRTEESSGQQLARRASSVRKPTGALMHQQQPETQPGAHLARRGATGMRKATAPASFASYHASPPPPAIDESCELDPSASAQWAPASKLLARTPSPPASSSVLLAPSSALEKLLHTPASSLQRVSSLARSPSPFAPPCIEHTGAGLRVRDAAAFLVSRVAAPPNLEDELCAEFAQEECLEMLRAVLPEELAMVSVSRSLYLLHATDLTFPRRSHGTTARVSPRAYVQPASASTRSATPSQTRWTRSRLQSRTPRARDSSTRSRPSRACARPSASRSRATITRRTRGTRGGPPRTRCPRGASRALALVTRIVGWRGWYG